MAAPFDLEALRGRLRKEEARPETSRSPPVAAVAVIINPNDRGGSILFIKRTTRLGDPWSGQIAFPGGHKASIDRDFLETALREAREEVGIDLREHEFLGHLPIVSARSGRVQVAPYVFLLKSGVVVRVNEEIAENFWAPLGSLGDLQVTRTDVEVEEGKLNVDAYHFDGRVIWGLTFRIINILLNRS